MPDLVVPGVDLVTAPGAGTYDLLTLAEGKRAINQPNLTDAELVAALQQTITAVSERIENDCGPVVNRTYSKNILDPRGTLLLSVPAGSPTFTVSFTSIVEYTSGTGTTLTAEDFDTSGTYRWDLAVGGLRRRTSWTDTSWGLQEVVINYTAGRAATTTDVPAKFKKAAAIIVNHDWRIEHGANSATFDDGEVVYTPTGFLIPRRAHDYLMGEFLGPTIG